MIINIDNANVHTDSLAVVQDQQKACFYLTAVVSKPTNPNHKVIANLASSSFKAVLETLKDAFIYYVERQEEPVVGNDASIFDIQSELPPEVGKENG